MKIRRLKLQSTEPARKAAQSGDFERDAVEKSSLQGWPTKEYGWSP